MVFPPAIGLERALLSRMTYRVSILEDFAQLALRAPSLTAAGPQQDAFACFGWYRNLYDSALACECRAKLFLVESAAGESVACLPLMAPLRRSSYFGPRTLSSMANYYSCLFGPIESDNVPNAAEMYHSLARAIKGVHPSFDVVDIHPTDAASRFHLMMRDAFTREGFLISEYFCFGNWYLPVMGRTFSQYFASRPSALRNTIVRKEKALRRLDDLAIAVERESGADLERAIADFNLIYSRSWKKPESFPDFIPGLCRFLARYGWLRLGVLRLAGKAVAAQIWIVKDRRAMIYKLAYDEQYVKLSVGSVLTKTLFEHVLTTDDVDEIDYLSGDDVYKREWMTHRRERYGLIAFNRSTIRGLILAARHFGGAAGRAVVGRIARSSP